MKPEEIQAGLRAAGEGARVAALAELAPPERDPAPYYADLAACLEHLSEPVRQGATLLLGRIGAPAAGALTRALEPNQPPGVRLCAAQALAALGPAAAPAMRELCRAITAPEDGLRRQAALALGGIGAPASPWLHRMLQFSDPLAVCAAVDGLGLVGPPAAHAAPDIQRLGASPLAKLRQACATALVKITGDPAAGLPILQRELYDPDPAVRKAALGRIGELQAAGQPAGGDVARCLADPDPEVRAAAALTLARNQADPAWAAPSIERLLRDPEAAVRVNAAMALAAYGGRARNSYAALDAMRRDADPGAAAAAGVACEKVAGA